MDFSSIPRALESLERRQPPLSERVLQLAKDLCPSNYNNNHNNDTNDDDDADRFVAALTELVSVPAATTGKDDATATDATTATATAVMSDRWEPLAVGLYIATQVLKEGNQVTSSGSNREDATTIVYMDGPRVPAMKKAEQETTNTTTSSNTTLSPFFPPLRVQHVAPLCRTLHAVALVHMEHPEPRVRTLVAQCVGAYCRVTWQLDANQMSSTSSSSFATLRQAIYTRLVTSIDEHIVKGRDSITTTASSTSSTNTTYTSTTTSDQESDPKGQPQAEPTTTTTKKYSQSSTGALDDTTGWRALETNWLCLAALVNALSRHYWTEFPLEKKNNNDDGVVLLKHCLYSCIEHLNRHVRAAAMTVLEHWILAAAASDDANVRSMLLPSSTSDPPHPLRTAAKAALTTGLADNWSQVRMAASVLGRTFLTRLQALDSPLDDLYPTLLPRMCLNRFYLAQGVKLYSHETWKLVVHDQGLALVAHYLPAVVRYYVKMCDADNHAVREAACQAIAELSVRMGEDPSRQYYATLQPHVDTLLQALLMCFHDESWPVRDEACLACGILCKSFPEECRPVLKTLWERWTEQLTDQIWSVREDAAVALGDALVAYGAEFLEQIRTFLAHNLSAARRQPAMTPSEYKQHVNDFEAHSNSQLYSCGSLAPKLRKGGAGRIGCTSCGIDRPKAPWEATDGCIYLIRELIYHGTAPDSKTPLSDEELVPMMRELADVCRVQHFPQSHDLRATLWKQLPAMANALGKDRFKRHYMELFMDLLFRNLESRSDHQLSIHAAGQCAEELAQLVGVTIFRARLEDDSQRATLDRVLRERQSLPKGPADGAAFSPFGPPGLLDTVGTMRAGPSGRSSH